MEKEITIITKYTFNDFIFPIKQKLLKSWGTWLVFLMAFGMLVFNILYLFDKSIYKDGIPIFNIIVPILVFTVLPLIIYYSLKRNYNNNYLAKEETRTTYNNKGISTVGETYQVFTEWSKIKSIKEHKSYFIINTNGIETFLLKSFFNNDKLKNFKSLIKELGF